jgi:hypothetical protein
MVDSIRWGFRGGNVRQGSSGLGEGCSAISISVVMLEDVVVISLAQI